MHQIRGKKNILLDPSMWKHSVTRQSHFEFMIVFQQVGHGAEWLERGAKVFLTCFLPQDTGIVHLGDLLFYSEILKLDTTLRKEMTEQEQHKGRDN